MTTSEGVDLASRETYPTGWSLLMEWWCVPVDMTHGEEDRFLEKMQNKVLGKDFARCPLAFIRDRLYGGFPCSDSESRRHVAFSTGQFSFIQAEHGDYWPLVASDRAGEWDKLRGQNEWIGQGPFVNDAGEMRP